MKLNLDTHVHAQQEYILKCPFNMCFFAGKVPALYKGALFILAAPLLTEILVLRLQMSINQRELTYTYGKRQGLRKEK